MQSVVHKDNIIKRLEKLLTSQYCTHQRVLSFKWVSHFKSLNANALYDFTIKIFKY